MSMISVVVPAYNVEGTVIRTLDSIMEQTYPEIEIIVVDDGSTDETGILIDNYSKEHQHIKVVHTENKGVTEARLRGVCESSGDWIGFVDADDEIEPDMYEILLKNGESNNASISHCGYQMIFHDGRKSYFYNTGRVMVNDNKSGLVALLEGTVYEPGLCNKLYKRSLFDNITDILDTKIKINEDLLMNYILFSKAEKTVFQDICKYHYLVRSTSASRAPLNKNKIYDPIHVRQLIMDMNIDGMKEPAEKTYVGTCVNVYNSIVMNDIKKYRSEQNSVRSLLKSKKKWIPHLSRKQQFLAYFIIWCPVLYTPVYRLYFKHFLVNPYG